MLGDSTDRASGNSVVGVGGPLVSVVIPAYNGELTIGQTLKSLTAQSYANLELIVVSDGCKDRTDAVVESFFSSKGLEGQLLVHSTNQGLARSLNDGLREARGDFVLILHQDIVLLSKDWIVNGLDDLRLDPTADVVTGDYGIPAREEIDFVQRTFGVMRRQFHVGIQEGVEAVTFSEFKCDLVRAKALRDVGGFPERFRIAGEDLWVCSALRAKGRTVLKDYRLRSVQRYTGDATTIRGNLKKEFVFGKALGGTVLRFGTVATRGLKKTPYSRSRTLNRVSQPVVLAIALGLLAGWLLSRNVWWVAPLALLVVARLGYYTARLYPDVARLLAGKGRAIGESIAGSFLGIGSDLAYSAGLLVGLVRWVKGSRV